MTLMIFLKPAARQERQKTNGKSGEETEENTIGEPKRSSVDSGDHPKINGCWQVKKHHDGSFHRAASPRLHFLWPRETLQPHPLSLLASGSPFFFLIEP